MVDEKFAKPDGERPTDPTEGVRIIGAEEAAEAMERGEVASRRGGAEPRYGDRPKPPPVGPRPVLRFPLDPTADPTALEKPPVRTGIEFEPLGGLGDGGGQRFDPLPDADALAMDVPAAAAPEPEPVAPAPVIEAEAVVGPVADEDVTGPLDFDDAPEPVAPVELPHWSDPATGEVPRVIVGEPEDGDDLDAWSSFAASSPRWRDSDRDWEAEGGMHEMLGADADWRVGAMDDSRPTDDETFSFEDLDRPVRAPAAPLDFDGDDDLDFAPLDIELEDEPAPDEPIAIGRRGARPGTRRPAPARNNPVADYASGGSGYAPPPSSGRNVGVATGVAIGFAAVALAVFYMGPKYAVGFVTVILVLAAVEFFGALRRAGLQPVVPVGLVATAALPLAAYWKGYVAFPIIGVLLVFTVLAWHLAEARPDAKVLESVGVTVFGVAWIGGLGAFAGLMLAGPDGVGFLIAVLLATHIGDAAAFFIGRSAGSRPLSEASPNKTYEGLIGGVFVSILLTVIIVGMIGIAPFNSVGAAVVLALVASLADPLGDLCESLLKRDLGVKDMGGIIPEHGGFLDRFDGLLFAMPAVYLVALCLHLGPFKV